MGDVSALNELGAAATRPAWRAELREIVEAAVAAASDHAAPELRANLAALCMAEGDAECVRFHALRAAARGSERAAAPLDWLRAHHPSPEVRADAQRWLALLAPGAGPAPERAALDGAR
jgi:hypothetical protein